MLTTNGAKLMDFGLAKQSNVASLSNDLTEMTADQARLTSAGMIGGLAENVGHNGELREPHWRES